MYLKLNRAATPHLGSRFGDSRVEEYKEQTNSDSELSIHSQY